MSTFNKRNPIAKAVKFALLATASVSTLSTPAVFAAEEEADEEKITITGSRIRRAEYVSESPVAVITSEQFELTGTVNTEDLLNTMPQVIPGLDRTSNNPGDGTATVDLRGLGAARTLVLVNGTRALPTRQDGVVDINTIPTSLIERVEVLTGGASAVYGSDAVAGVVNFILKDDFEGVEVSAGYQQTSEDDGAQFTTNLTLGGNFAEGKGNAVFNLSLTSRDPVFQGDRDFAFFAQFDDVDANGNPTLINGGSSGVPQTSIFAGGLGAFSPDTFGILFNQDGSVRQFRTSGDDNDFYNYAPVNFLQVPQERRQATFLGHYEFADGHEMYGRALFTRSVVDQQLAPTPIFQTASFTLDGSPFIPAASQQILSDAIGEGVDTDGDGIDDTGRALLRRRLLEVGPRFVNNQNTSYQFKYGIRGDIGDSNWRYDAYYQTGEVSRADTQLGNVNRDRFNQALLLDLAADPTGGTCQDTSSNGSTIGCSPINVFGQGNISADGAAFLNTAVAAVGETTQNIWAASVDGDTEGWFELPGGPIAVAFGYEYIENSADFRPSQDLAAGTIAGFNGQPPSGGEFDVTSWFTELNLPILRDVAGAESLDISLAYRTSSYSTSGSVTMEKIGLTWAPIDSLLFRAGFNTAIRAPNISELFAPASEGFPGAIDPCSAEGSDQGAAVAAICQANGVPANVLFTPAINLPAGQVRNISGGNPNLFEEEADTKTFGVVFTPMDNLSISVDRYDIEVEGAISTFGGGASNILNTCFDPNDLAGGTGSVFCNAINRRGDGTIDFVLTAQQNVSFIDLKGWDVIANYNFEVGGGRFDIDYVATVTDDANTQPFAGAQVITCAGEFGNTCGQPTPEYKHRTTFKWSKDDFRVQLLWRHIGSIDDDDEDNTFFVESLDSENYFDISASYNLNENFNISGGVRNISDKKPPIIGDNQQQANTWPGTYDVFGSTYFVTLRANF